MCHNQSFTKEFLDGQRRYCNNYKHVCTSCTYIPLLISLNDVLKILPRNGVAISRDYNILSITFQSIDWLTEGIDYSNSSQIVFASLRRCGSHMYCKGQFKKFLDSLHNYLAINIACNNNRLYFISLVFCHLCSKCL